MLRWTACALLIASSAAAQEYVPGRVLIHYKSSAIPQRIPLRGRARFVRSLAPHTHVVEVPDTQAALDELRGAPEVESAEPDYLRHRADAVTPNDEMYGLQWALPAIHAPEAWAQTTGSASVVVAVIDTGILLHPDLKDRLVAGWDFISDASSAGDGDGRDADPTDPGTLDVGSSMLHGTHVSGIIGAVADNHLGIAGLDWGCRIQPVRVLGVQGGKGADSDIADAIRWAAGLHVDGVPDNLTPADVINLSFDGRGRSVAMQEAVDDAIAHGAAVVAAAGNEAADGDDDVPAGLHGVITVGAVDETKQRASYSNFGPAVALLAPGGVYANDGDGHSEAILSTLFSPPTGWTYVDYAGTSQAAPYVSGAISLMKALYPSLTPLRARSLLVASADAGSRCVSPANASQSGCGAGLLDVDAALTLAAAQAACGERCGDDQICSAGLCVAGAAATVDAGSGAARGCATTGAHGGGAAGSAIAWIAAIAAVSRRRARAFVTGWIKRLISFTSS